MNILDRIQARAARLFPSYRDKLDSLALRRNVSGLCQLQRIVRHSAPPLVTNYIKPVPLRVARSTRTSEKSLGALQPPRSRTTFHQNSFLPHYIGMWNELSDEVLFAESLQKFKTGAVQHFRQNQARIPAAAGAY